MPSRKKSNKGSGKIKDLKSRKLAAGKAENVKGGAGNMQQDPLNLMSEAVETITKSNQWAHDQAKALLSNIRA